MVASSICGDMSGCSRNDIDPNWEPMPWDSPTAVVDAQERAFQSWALTKLEWVEVTVREFSAAGIFGSDRDWFVRNDVRYITHSGNAQLVLIDRTYSGFPDPPRWGLAARQQSAGPVDWDMLGSFPDIPQAWNVPNQNG